MPNFVKICHRSGNVRMHVLSCVRTCTPHSHVTPGIILYQHSYTSPILKGTLNGKLKKSYNTHCIDPAKMSIFDQSEVFGGGWVVVGGQQ